MTDKERAAIASVIANYDSAIERYRYEQDAWADFQRAGGVEPLRKLLEAESPKQAITAVPRFSIGQRVSYKEAAGLYSGTITAIDEPSPGNREYLIDCGTHTIWGIEDRMELLDTVGEGKK